MFTGIVETTGIVAGLTKVGDYKKLTIRPGMPLKDIKNGDSIAVDGCCLTVIAVENDYFAAEVSPETMRATILNNYAVGTEVNLERALRFNDRMGGHFVTGHVDTTGIVRALKRQADVLEMLIEYPDSFSALLVAKGSIAVNGISLTVNEVKSGLFSVNLIPFTRKTTTAGTLQIEMRVNIEFDLIGKYILQRYEMENRTPLTLKKLTDCGW